MIPNNAVQDCTSSGLAELAAKADGHQLLENVTGSTYFYRGDTYDGKTAKYQLLLPWMVLVLDRIFTNEAVFGLSIVDCRWRLASATYYDRTDLGGKLAWIDSEMVLIRPDQNIKVQIRQRYEEKKIDGKEVMVCSYCVSVDMKDVNLTMGCWTDELVKSFFFDVEDDGMVALDAAVRMACEKTRV